MQRVWTASDLARIDPVPWKNGGGQTRELACAPSRAGAADFSWRVSVADVRQDGPFSHFPGMQRIIVGLAGNGFDMRFDDGRHHALSTLHMPFSFAGDDALTAHLIDGESRDFNLMVDRARARGGVDVWRGPGRHVLASPAVLVMIAQGSAVWQTAVGSVVLRAGAFLSSGPRETLPPGTEALSDTLAPQEGRFALDDQSVALVVNIWPIGND